MRNPWPACLLTLAAQGCATQTPEPDFTGASREVCRTERPTGSHIPQRVCHTAEERAAMEAAAKEVMRRQATTGTGCATPDCS